MESLLFELLRVAIGKQGCLSHTPTAGEWRELYLMAEKQALLGICFHGVESLHEQRQTPPQDLLFEWIGAAEYIKQKNALQNKRCVELQKMLKEAGLALQKYFVVRDAHPQQLNVNLLTLQQLRKHPYINFYQAKAIVDYRRLHGNLKSLQDLRLSKDFPPEVIERLTPYVTF